jgi:hypothetical protein
MTQILIIQDQWWSKNGWLTRFFWPQEAMRVNVPFGLWERSAIETIENWSLQIGHLRAELGMPVGLRTASISRLKTLTEAARRDLKPQPKTAALRGA